MNSAIVDQLSHIVADIRSDADSLTNYGRDWSRLQQPNPSVIAFPRSIEEAQQLVLFANQQRLALVPSGGRTGMSGGALAMQGEVVVSFERMNQILHFDATAGSVICQPGVITQTLQDYAREQGYFYPVDFGGRGSSHIGGNIATNAGGIKVIRYGLTRNWVTGLKVITGKGDLLNLNKGLIKNATGYDLRHLFIGSEGTLGLIVEATLQLTRQPANPQVMLFAVADLAAITQVFAAFQKQLELNAFECFSARCLQYVIAHGVKQPLATEAPYYVVLEFDDTNGHALDKALAIYEHCTDQQWLLDGVVSESEAQARALWRLREDITEAIAHYKPYKNDVSVAVANVADFLRTIDELFTRQYPNFDVLCFGHVGDGNMHINIIKPEAMDYAEFVGECERVNTLLFKTLQRYDGSISAEHGVGITKKPYLSYSRSENEISYMKALKQVFDPIGIMNPGKIFD